MIRTGLIGKILSKLISDPKDDHNYDHKPGESNTAKIANDKQKMMKAQMLKAGKPPVNMNSPLDSYENPKFVNKQAGQAASNIASKALLDGAVKKFNDPAEKSKRQKNRADRLTKRANSKRDRLNARADRRDKRNMGNAKTGDSNDPSYARINPYAPNDKVKAYNAKTDKIRAKAGTKKIELDKRAGEMQVKSDANKMIAEERAKRGTLTDNQWRLAQENEAKNNENNKAVNMFSLSKDIKQLAKTDKQKKLDKLFNRPV